MLRRLLVDATSISLLLCIGTAMFWLRNPTSVELLAVANGSWPDSSPRYTGRAVSFGAADGRIALCIGHWSFDFSHPEQLGRLSPGPKNPLQYRRRGPRGWALIHKQHALGGAYTLPADWHGFDWDLTSSRQGAQWEESCGLTLPAWLIMLLTAVLPAGGAVGKSRRFLREHRSGPRVSLPRRQEAPIAGAAAIA